VDGNAPDHVYPLMGGMIVRDITPAHVIQILEPIWPTKTETASRVRFRIELVLDYAGAKGLRQGPNPARWRSNLDAALSKASKVAKLAHHAAVPVSSANAFFSRLRSQPGMGARAVEFVVLTAARSGEVRGVAWAEINLDAEVWTIPAQRMKAGREHRVALSTQAMELLKHLGPGVPEALVFAGRRGPLSDMSLTAVMRRMKDNATVHGFRNTFRDWVSDHTDYPHDAAEIALAHAVGDKVEAAAHHQHRQGDPTPTPGGEPPTAVILGPAQVNCKC